MSGNNGTGPSVPAPLMYMRGLKGESIERELGCLAGQSSWGTICTNLLGVMMKYSVKCKVASRCLSCFQRSYVSNDVSGRKFMKSYELDEPVTSCGELMVLGRRTGLPMF